MMLKKVVAVLSLFLTVNFAVAAQVTDLSQKKQMQRHAAAQTRSTQTQSEPKIEALHPIAKVKDLTGQTHIRSQQTYNGIPIWNYRVIEHQGKRGMTYSGSYVSQISQDLARERVAQKTPQQVMDFVRQHYLNTKPVASVLGDGTAKPFIYIDENHIAHSVYEISFQADSPEQGSPSVPTYLIDAHSLVIYKTWDKMMHLSLGEGPGGNRGTGRYFYGVGKDFQPFDIKLVKNTCFMENTYVKTVNLNHGFRGTAAYGYACNPAKGQYYHDERTVNEAYGVINDAHAFGDALIAMYQDWYGVNPLPIQLVMRVHYGKNYANAMWDSFNQTMSFGDGDGVVFYPLVSIDVAAHEVAHGITQYASDLIYDGQSGALNESFSDMAAQAAQYYLYGINDWSIGASIIKIGGALRYMDDPTRDGYSIAHVQDYNEGIDVHLSSGVYNKVFYLLATTPGWDVQKAYTVFYYANLVEWQPEETFASAGCGAVRAAATLHDYEPSINTADVVSALEAVGIHYDANTQVCSI